MTVEQLLSECDLVRLTEENAIGTEVSVSPNVRWKWDDGIVHYGYLTEKEWVV